MVRSAKKKEAAWISELFGRELGEGFCDQEGIRTAIEDERELVLVGELAGRPAAALLGVEEDDSELEERMPAGAQHAITALVRSGAAGRRALYCVDMIATERWARGRGLGSTLIEAALKHAMRRRCRYAYTLAWHTSDGCHLAGVLERGGWQWLGMVERAYYQDSLENGYSCPYCGIPCHCSSAIYGIALD